MASFAKRLVDGFPTWQVVLVDLRWVLNSTDVRSRLP